MGRREGIGKSCPPCTRSYTRRTSKRDEPIESKADRREVFDLRIGGTLRDSCARSEGERQFSARAALYED